MNPSLLSRRGLLAACAILSLPLSAAAQSGYPSKPITWLVGQPAGGTTDILTRLVARQAEQSLGQPIVVDNRPGAAGAIALQAAVKAAPDGYTLITMPGPILTSTPVPRIGKELTGVATLARGAMVLVGGRSAEGVALPPTLPALLQLSREQPRLLSYATSGNGTSQHLAGELIKQMSQAGMTHVPYKGGGQAVIDLVGGQIPLGVLGITPLMSHIQSGKLHAYGVTTARRSPSLPAVPTLAEAGLPGFDADQWFVAAVPAGVDAARIARLNAAISQALQSAELRRAFEANGVSPGNATPQQATSMVVDDMRRWQALAQKAQLPLE